MHLVSKSGRTISLRPPGLGDLDRLYQYAKNLEAEDTYVLLNPEMPVTYSEEKEYLDSSLKKIAANWLIYYLAFSDDQLIGSSQITLGGRRRLHQGQFGISILPQFRGEGIGFQLADFVINEAKTKLKLNLVTLEVFAANKPALNLYRKLGFREYGRLPNGLKYRGELMDDILMYKTLI